MTDGITASRASALDTLLAKGVWLAFPGAASHIATVAGAAIAIEEELERARAQGNPDAKVKGTVGISAGAGVGTAVAFGVLDRLPKVLRHWLQDQRVLDFVPDGKVGLCAWERIPRLVDELIGPGRKMGEAKVPLAILVADADAAKRGEDCVVVLSSWATPDVLVSEAVAAAMAIVPLAPMVRIPSRGTAMTPDIRLHFDCGWTKNVPDDIFDDRAEPTIAMTLRHREPLTGKPTRVTEADPLAQIEALAGAVSQALNRRNTRRTDGLHIVLDAVGSSLDFDLSPEETSERIQNGRRGVEAAFRDLEAP
jgi:predicted acylesterase/phospholipase RssA